VKRIRMQVALRAVHESETGLGDELRKLAQRHAADHDVYHVGLRLAAMGDERVRLLAEQAPRYGSDLPAEEEFAPFEGIVAAFRRMSGELAARSEKSAVLLLRDLRNLYVAASECNVAWTILGQGAQAARDDALIHVVYACQQDVGRTVHWLESRIKETAPLVLAG